MPPQIVLSSVPEQIRNQFSYPISESPFYNPFHNFPDNFDAEMKQALVDEGKKVVLGKIFPAFEKLEKLQVKANIKRKIEDLMFLINYHKTRKTLRYFFFFWFAKFYAVAFYSLKCIPHTI